tara:strand:+ start:594 stop:824 length:231 start_codon:yes stop_codon:yes gene_type:complete
MDLYHPDDCHTCQEEKKERDELIKESQIKPENYELVTKIKDSINAKLEESIMHMELMSLWEDASEPEEVDPPMIDY